MIIVHGCIPFRPECRDQALELAKQMAAASRNERGCMSYEFYVGLADPDTLMLFQEWESMEALMGHFDTDHMDDFLQRLPDLVSGEIVTRRYAVQVVDDDEPTEAVAAEPIIH
jgi:quinol monooxygenase YgiN